MNDMNPVIGIVGGMASGKSTVASYLLQKFRAFWVEADKVNHWALEQPEVMFQMRSRWQIDSAGISKIGKELGIAKEALIRDDKPVRSTIASLVFQNKSELKFLESITRPLVDEKLKSFVTLGRQSESFRMVLLDAPLLFEAGWSDMCDYLVFVDTPEEKRIENYAKRSGKSLDNAAKDLRRREENQLHVNYKKILCHTTVDNTGDLENLHKQLYTTFMRFLCQ